jgi:hypothetical protein
MRFNDTVPNNVAIVESAPHRVGWSKSGQPLLPEELPRLLRRVLLVRLDLAAAVLRTMNLKKTY